VGALFKVIWGKCSEALHILDRFHIVAKMNKALDEIRAKETRRMKRGRARPGAEEVPLTAAETQRERRR
jgi:hypothetical protein